MTIDRSIDVEEAIRASLIEYIQAYVRPLPKNLLVPSIAITAVGGDTDDKVDHFEVVLDSRADEEATALENLRNAVGIIIKIAESQTTDLRFAKVNTLSSWGKDPVRPDLAMCSARLRVIAHTEIVEVNKK